MIDIKDLSYQEKSEIYQQLQKEFAVKRIDKKLEEVNKKKTEYQKLKVKLKDKFGYDSWKEKLISFSFHDFEFRVKGGDYHFSTIEDFDHYGIILIDIKYQKEIEKMVSDFEEYEYDKEQEASRILVEVRKKKEELENKLKNYK